MCCLARDGSANIKYLLLYTKQAMLDFVYITYHTALIHGGSAGTSVSSLPIRPPVQDSAVASVSPCSFRRAITASALVFIFIIPDLRLFSVGNGAGDQALNVQLLLLGLNLCENRLCLRMLRRKDSAAILIRKNRGIQRPNAAGDGDDLLLGPCRSADGKWAYGRLRRSRPWRPWSGTRPVRDFRR